MGTFEIHGGRKLSGEIVPQGAKNEALQVLCAVLLTSEEVIIRKIPNIIDVNKLIDLLRDLGVKVEKVGPEDYSFKADTLYLDYLDSPEFKNQRRRIARINYDCWSIACSLWKGATFLSQVVTKLVAAD